MFDNNNEPVEDEKKDNSVNHKSESKDQVTAVRHEIISNKDTLTGKFEIGPKRESI